MYRRNGRVGGAGVLLLLGMYVHVCKHIGVSFCLPRIHVFGLALWVVDLFPDFTPVLQNMSEIAIAGMGDATSPRVLHGNGIYQTYKNRLKTTGIVNDSYR